MIEKVNPSQERWCDIPEYKGKYQISNLGRIKSLSRTSNNRNGSFKTKEIIMKPMKASNGYLIACLWKNNKQKKFIIHKLVADAFIPNPNGYKEINHKDENKENNIVDNLEWCNHKYNMNYGKIKEKISKSRIGIAPWNKGIRKEMI